MFINAKNSRAFNAKKTRQSPITKVISESHHINKSKEKKIHIIILIDGQWQLTKFDICSYYFKTSNPERVPQYEKIV